MLLSKNKITQIRKRDGRIMDFDQNKITEAIWRAMQAVVEGTRKKAEKLSQKVVETLNKKFHPRSIPAVEEIQDIIEEILISARQIKAAKAYILYREQHAQIREMRHFINSDELMEGYLKQIDWRVRENANMAYSLQGLNIHVATAVSSHYWLHKIYPPEIREAHLGGDFHIHDLYLLASYCCGWDLKDLLIRGFGGVTGKIHSKPPKHFRSALGQAVNFIYTLQGEVAGAEAFSNFDTLLAPFIRYDGLDYPQVKQAMQEFLFNINVPTRTGFQSLTWDELVVVRHQDKIKFLEIGKLVDEEFEKNKHRVLEANPTSYAVANFDNYQVLSFNKKGQAHWSNVKAFIRHKVPQGSKFIKIRTSKGSACVSRAHSLFSFSELNEKFNPQATSALDIKIAHFNKKITPKNHFLALRSVANEGGQDTLDIRDLIDVLEPLKKNTYVEINPSRTLAGIKNKVLEEYKGLTPFYIEFGLKDTNVWQDWLESRSVRYDIWRRFGEDQSTQFKMRNSKIYFPRILKGEKLENFVKLCAWYISEGHNDLTNGLYISQSDKQEIERILRSLKMLGRLEESKGYSPQGHKTKVVYKIAAKGLLANIVSLACGTYSAKKVIPWFIYNLKPRLQEIFISTLLKGDAAEYPQYWDYSTTSRKLSLSLSLLLAQNGYRFSVYEEDLRRIHENWHNQYTIRIFKDKNSAEKYSVGDFAARICSQLEEIPYEKEYEYDISVSETQENFAGGSGLLMFHNTPFSNITLDLFVPEIFKDEAVIIGGQPQKEKYGQFQKEIDMFNRAFAECMLEGDAVGRVFTFPIPTYNVTKDFDWENPILTPVWKMTAKYGIPYFANFINSDMKPDDVRSMCCRLRLSNRELRKRGGGLFGANPLTGSIGVVTLNMARLGYFSKTKKDFFARLGQLMEIAKKSLEIKREALEKFTTLGLYPYCRVYLAPIKKRFGQYWRNHFNTIGLVGLNESCLNFEPIRASIASAEGHKFAVEVLHFMRERLMDYQLETNNLYNLEATPAEGTSYRLAKIDKEKYPNIIVANEKAVQEKKAAPYYTNSSQLHVSQTDDIFGALELQDELQTCYTGGTVLHGFIGEKMPSGEATKRLVKKIAENFHLPYFTITPTFSICPKHGYLAGEHFFCPHCDQEIGYVEEGARLCAPVVSQTV